MNDSLKKTKVAPEAVLEDFQVLSEKDPTKFTKAKEPKDAFLEQTGIHVVPKQAGRDWWWCDDV